jgi:uncharacterized lipoprotein
MRTILAVGVALVAMVAAGCGSSDEPKKKEKDDVMKVEDTAFGPLVGTPKKVQDKTDAAAETYRDNLNKRLDEDEGANKKDEPPQD